MAELLPHTFHFREGMLVAGAVGGGDAFVETGEGFFGAARFDESLRGHLVARDIIGIVLDEGVEFDEGLIGVVFSDVGHGEAVAGEGVCGVLLEDLGEEGDLVHGLMVRCGGRGWQVSMRAVRLIAAI